MAHPTRKHTASRQGKRRGHWKLRRTLTTQCGQCGRQIVPHCACKFCGYYRGKAVVTIKVKKSKQEAKAS